jgi:hypothetical protein
MQKVPGEMNVCERNFFNCLETRKPWNKRIVLNVRVVVDPINSERSALATHPETRSLLSGVNQCRSNSITCGGSLPY